ncbi:hypothetical protein HN011_000092 [Eciton burchellii]|nr:hypothetical protein HN011_000092 [Eciton burchellii]
MSPRGLSPPLLLLLLLLGCIFYCCAQEIKDVNKTKPIMSEQAVISTVMVCTMFSVVVVLVPTVLYYRYCSKEEDE